VEAARQVFVDERGRDLLHLGDEAPRLAVGAAALPLRHRGARGRRVVRRLAGSRPAAVDEALRAERPCRLRRDRVPVDGDSAERLHRHGDVARRMRRHDGEDDVAPRREPTAAPISPGWRRPTTLTTAARR
jgi:hypothetical protein